nr:hypothetical protein [uncultured Oscillibacter sp.]
MKWSDFSYDDFYIPYDENQKAIRGFLLATLNVDLNNIPAIFNEDFSFTPSIESSEDTYIEKKVFLTDIVGTSYSEYGGKSIIQAFMRIKRASTYIRQGRVTRSKYHYMLKRPARQQPCPIKLSYDKDSNTYWVDGNGNHRVILYKIMMLAEIAEKYEWACSEDYDIHYNGFSDIRNRYWLYALVRNTSLDGDAI